VKNTITVVICLYNAEPYIIETLNSLSDQTFTDFDILILDDCSTDQSVERVVEFSKSEKNLFIEIIRFHKNQGTAFLRNYALHHVSTDYMMFFDADDIAKPELVMSLKNKLASRNNIIAVSCYSKYIDEKSELIFGGQYIGPVDEQEFMNRAESGKLILMLPPTLFERRAAINVGGYRLSGFPKSERRYQDLSEDLDLWSRMSDLYKENKIMVTLPKELFFYRKITSSLSSSKSSLIAMQMKIRFIKENIKRRRKGIEEISFIDYMDSISFKEKIVNFFKDRSAFHYREAGFSYVNKNFPHFLCNLMLSVFFNPFYLLDKIKSNLSKENQL